MADERDVSRLVDRIRPLLAGNSPEVQGCVLADLVSLWISGHHPDLREDALSMFTTGVCELLPVNDAILYGPAGFPKERQ